VQYTRLFSDDLGESHFETLDAQFRTVDFAPPAPPLDISLLGSAEQCLILRAKPGWRGDWHPAPFRQLHFYLSGEVEAETSDGEKRCMRAGSVVLVEDTSGKGHRGRVVGSSDVLIAVVRLPETDAQSG
jgi:quercetin dioxygenase-like cupin family protein